MIALEPASYHAVLVSGVETFEPVAQQAFTALVPGGHVVVHATSVRTNVSGLLILAGFEVRGALINLMPQPFRQPDEIAGGEFPEVQDGMELSTNVWALGRKPCSERTVADNLRRWGTGGFRRISSDQPFGDVIRGNVNHFVEAVVRALMPLGHGALLVIGKDARALWAEQTNLPGYSVLRVDS